MRVSGLTGSVPRKMAEAWQSVSTLIRNQTHIAQLTATNFNHSAIGSHHRKKRCMTRRISPPATSFLRTGLLYLDFSS